MKRYCEIEELNEGCNPEFEGTGCFCRDKDLCNGNENPKHSDFIIYDRSDMIRCLVLRFFER